MPSSRQNDVITQLERNLRLRQITPKMVRCMSGILSMLDDTMPRVDPGVANLGQGVEC